DAGLHLLHRLAARERAEAVDVGLAVHEVPELLGAATRHRVLDRERAAQAHDVGGTVAALDALPARIGRPFLFEGGNLLFAAELFGEVLRHGHSGSWLKDWRVAVGVTVRRHLTLMSYRRHILF